MKLMFRLLIAIGLLVIVPATSRAAAIIEFSTAGGGAGGFVDRVADRFVGVAFPINGVTISGAPRNNGVFDVDGISACQDPIGGCGYLSFDVNTQLMALVGSIPELGVPYIPLVLGSTFNMTSIAIDVDGIRLRAYGDDTKAAELLAALGLDPSPFIFDLSVTGTPLVPGRLETFFIGSDVNLLNRPTVPTPVPEPGSMLLLGTGLFAVLRARKRG